MSSMRKITELFEGNVVAGIYEKARDDGRRFYDTSYHRRYKDENDEERRSDLFQLRDTGSMHILLVRVENYIKDKIRKNRNKGSDQQDMEDSYATEE